MEPFGGGILYTALAGLFLQVLFLTLGAAVAAVSRRFSAWKITALILGCIFLQKAVDLLGLSGLFLLISPFSYFKPERYLYQTPVSAAAYCLTILWTAAGLSLIFYCYPQKDIQV